MRIEHYDADREGVVPLEAYRVHQTVIAQDRAKKAESDLVFARKCVDELREQNDRLLSALKTAAVQHDATREELAALKASTASQIRFRDKGGRYWTLGELWAEVELLRSKNAEQANLIHDMVMRAAPPVVHMTDIEGLTRDLSSMVRCVPISGQTPDAIRLRIMQHTQPLDREGLAAAMWDDDGHGKPWSHRPITEDGRGEYLRTADAVLRHLGAQAAQPVEPKPPEPAKVRVKLPKTIYDKERRTLTVSATELRASLRSQGVEVEE